MPDNETIEPTEVAVPAVVTVPVSTVVETTAVEVPAPEVEVDEPEAPPEHAFLLKDIGDAIERVKRSKHLGETKGEFANELYPLLQSIVEYFGERQMRSEAALAELIDQTDSFVQSDLALQIANALNLGKAMAQIMLQMKPGMVLEAKGVAKCQALANQYITAADIAAESVANVTIEEGEDEEDDDEEEEGK